MFTVTGLGTLGGGDISATAINDHGQVLGRIRMSDEENREGFNQRTVLWDQGDIVDLGTNFVGAGLNNRGQVVGSSIPDDWDPLDLSGATASRPALHDGQRTRDLFDGRVSGSANAINSDGQIVGTVWHSLSGEGQPPQRELHTFLWTRGEPRHIPVPPEYVRGVPNAINDQAEAVGFLQTLSADSRLSQSAALWRQDQVVLLGALPDADQSEAVAVNNRGAILCRAFFGLNQTKPTGGGFSQRGYLWENGRLQDLAVTGGTSPRPVDVSEDNIPRALNDQGQIVGQATDMSGEMVAFVCQGGVMENLNDLIPADSGWALWEAIGVNVHGQIVGRGKHNGQRRAFLLSPAQ